ncbi:hypothetical protein [Leptolyngbya sp. Heron Island J]|nr:hypothetical protein [Leptolyngbya sp. Heron Island J]
MLNNDAKLIHLRWCDRTIATTVYSTYVNQLQGIFCQRIKRPATDNADVD